MPNPTEIDRLLEDLQRGGKGGIYSGAFLGDEFRGSVMDQLLRSIGSLQSQSLNRFQDTATANNVPLATRLAGERGIALQGAQQVQQGVSGLEQFIAGSNRDVLLNLLALKQGQELTKMQTDAEKSAALMQMIGQGANALGFLVGGGG